MNKPTKNTNQKNNDRNRNYDKISVSSLSIIQNAPGPKITYPFPEDFDPFPEFPEYKLKYTRKELCDMFWDDYGGKPSAAENNKNKQYNEAEADIYYSWQIADWVDGNP